MKTISVKKLSKELKTLSLKDLRIKKNNLIKELSFVDNELIIRTIIGYKVVLYSESVGQNEEIFFLFKKYKNRKNTRLKAEEYLSMGLYGGYITQYCKGDDND